MLGWEYRIWGSSLPITVEELNELGSEGWELVSVIRWTPKLYEIRYAYYFKRPVKEGRGEHHLA